MGKYYVVGANKDLKKSNVLKINLDGKLVTEFPDIADIDLSTTKIKIGDFRKTIKSNNESFDRKEDVIFIAQYPYKKVESKIYYILQEGATEKSKQIVDGLIPLAKERSEKIRLKDGSVLEKDQAYYDYVNFLTDSIISDIYSSSDINKLFKQDTLIIKYLKERFLSISYSCNSKNIEFESKRIKDNLSNYKSLRNLVLEYVLYLEKKDIYLRKKIIDYTKKEDNGSFLADDYVTESIKKGDDSYHQLTLSELFEM